MTARVVCLKILHDQLQVLLVRDLTTRPRWQFPGGEMEPGAMPYEAATAALRAQTGYAGHVKRSPVAHRTIGKIEVSFLLVRDAVPVAEALPRAPQGWFHLECAAEALKEYRPEADADSLLSALATAVHWFYLQ